MKKKIRDNNEKIIKLPKLQTIFCISSLVFILICFIYYDTRFVKYYKIYNPKSESGEKLATLASSIISNSSIVYEGDGLYINSGNYIYKGENVDNYVLLSNMLFRIIKINNDKTINLVLDEYINKEKYDDEFKNFDLSNLSKSLNSKFLNVLDNDLLIKTNICNDTIIEINRITCNNISNNNYVRILGLDEFINSLNDDRTYLVKDKEYLWLYNQSLDKIWHTNKTGLNMDLVTSEYGIKPVVTLKNSVILLNGDGTFDNPYRVQENINKINIGTYLDINDEIYIVYDLANDYFKVQSDKLLKDIIFDDKTNEYKNSSLKKYLEEEYLASLRIDNILKEVDFNGISSKISILSKDDFKFNSDLKNYFLIDKIDKEVSLYNSSLRSSKVNVKRNVRPTLGLIKDLKIVSGNGSKKSPFIVEVNNA